MTHPTKANIGLLIARTALRFIGHQYVWGGAPGPNWTGGWDCSSFTNSVVGGMCGQSIPGFPNGTYNGTEHGPNTTIWRSAIGGIVGTIPRAAVQPGDIMLWTTHMGMAISNIEMMSAENPVDGTQKGVIDGFMGSEPLTCLRLATVGPGSVNFPPIVFSGTAGIDKVSREMAQALRVKVEAQTRLYHVGRGSGRV